MIAHQQSEGALNDVFRRAAQFKNFGIGVIRFGLVVVLLWIGGLSFTSYEAEGIVPIVSNSPLMSFFYRHAAPEYQQHMNRQGEVIPANREWHTSNGTYGFRTDWGL